VGHAWSVADRSRIFSTFFGCIVQPSRPTGCPNWLMISAATPTACGEAIDVPWMYW
jgi:hypothetical protein